MSQDQSQTSTLSSNYLLENYQLLDGSLDEMLTSSGEVRPIWQDFVQHLGQLSPENLQKRTHRGDQYLHDAGVFYRQYDDAGTQERDWPLSHIPVLVSEKEWDTLCEGLSQRADLLEDILNDVYGENILVRDGILPPHLVANNPEWLRPLVGAKPRGGHHLQFLAFEIGRGPAGNWWVLGDRAQAPSGAGFALENRVATSRVFSDFFGAGNIERLAGFFQEFRTVMQDLSAGPDEILGILSPGRMTDTYFEHAYIARYLGLTLLEGEDMTVVNGNVMVRTVQGLKPISVLWRRLDALFADPLELNEDSQLGTAGLTSAARNGSISLVNALGSGIVETRAFLAFMPHICKTLRNETLKIPNIATWWCGQKNERQHVRSNAQNMLIGSAMTTSLPFSLDQTTTQGNAYQFSDLKKLDSLLESDGDQLVGQEAVTLSTTPVLENGKLTPKPVTLRVFACRTENGWKFMPGGYARIGKNTDPSAIALQQGGSVADVWVVSDNKVKTPTLISHAASTEKRANLGNLPSRSADNLFWLGRYAERTELQIRLLRAYHLRLAENEDPQRPLLKLLEQHMSSIGMSATVAPLSSIINVLHSALNSAGQLRDRFSDDGWLALKNLLNATLKLQKSQPSSGDDMARAMNDLIQKVTSFSGLIHENMYRFTGWRFLSIGRSLERALETSSILLSFAEPNAPIGALDVALEIADSSMSHRRLFTVDTHRRSVIDLIALDELNPRSILYHVVGLQIQTSFLPSVEKSPNPQDIANAIQKMVIEIKSISPESASNTDFVETRKKLGKISSLLANVYFS